MKLTVRDLSFRYREGRQILSGVSFSLSDGDILSILGANGAGKSTLLSSMAGLLTPQSGSITIDGRELSAMSKRERAGNIGYIPQLSGDTFAFSLLEYVVMGRTPYLEIYQRPSPSDYDAALRALGRAGLAGMEDKLITEISGGERQLAKIAKVLAQEARIILMDEPANHLDYGNQYRVMGIMKKLAEDGYIIINTTHNPDHVLVLGGKTAVLDSEGRIDVGDTCSRIDSDTLSSLYHIDISTKYVEEAGRRICFVRPER